MPKGDLILGSADSRMTAVRTEPAQRRSAERLDALLDAAAAVVDDIGPERLTTQLVAENAGASIGTVYRYFPDRVAVIKGLRERSVQRYRERLAAALGSAELGDWWAAVDLAITVCAECYRDEPGFRIVRGSERDREPEAPGTSVLADRLAQLLEAEFDSLPGDAAALRFRLDVVVEVADALVARSVAGGSIDEAYLDECRRIVHGYLAEYLGASELRSGAEVRKASAA